MVCLANRTRRPRASISLAALKALLIFLPELVALKTLAVLSSVLVAVPFYYLVRYVSERLVAAFLTTLLLMSGMLIEIMTYGGYPHLLAAAYMVASLFFLDRWLASARQADLLWSAGCAALVIFTNHFTALIMIACLAVYVPFCGWRRRDQLKPFAKQVAVWGGVASALSILALPWYLKFLSLVAGQGTINASGDELNGLGNILSYVFAEAPLTWLALASIVPLIAMAPIASSGAARLRPIAAALTIGPLAIFVITNEPRPFQIMQIGMLLSLGLVISYALGFVQSLNIRPKVALAARGTLASGALMLALILLPNGHLRFEDALGRYGALDAPAIEALDWLRENTPPEAAVLPNDRSGWVSYAWWVEGYARRPAFSLIDPNYLAFEEEQEQSAIAARIINESTPAAEARALVRDAGIHYFFIYKPSGGQFQALVEKVPVLVSFENDDFVILRVDFADQAFNE